LAIPLGENKIYGLKYSKTYAVHDRIFS